MDGPMPMIPVSDRAALLARVHIGVTVPLLALTLVTVIARVRLRVRPVWRVRVDDWLVVIGFVRCFSSTTMLAALTASRRLP